MFFKNFMLKRVKTFRFKTCAIKKVDGKDYYHYDNPNDIDDTINKWIKKEKALILDIKRDVIVMRDKQDINRNDILYTIVYCKL